MVATVPVSNGGLVELIPEPVAIRAELSTLAQRRDLLRALLKLAVRKHGPQTGQQQQQRSA